MNNIKRYVIYIIIFLIIGEILHESIKYYIKKINNNNTSKKEINEKVNNEGFTNYNELPHLTNLTKSYPRRVTNISHNIENNLEPIVVTTKVPVLSSGQLPTIGYYCDNNYANSLMVRMIKKEILPVLDKQYDTSKKILKDIELNKANLGIIRDYEVLNNNTGKLEVIAPLLFETVYMITTNKINISHFQLINLQEKPIKIFTNPNDIEVLELIISIFKIDSRKLEIYVIKDISRCISEFILDDKSILFICCHFKNKYLQSLLENKKCCVLEYIPTLDTLKEIGNYSKRKPINTDALLKIKSHMLNQIYDTMYINKIYKHNLSKNNVVSLTNSKIYNTLNIRNSLYINKKNFTNYQLEMLSSNMIKKYQTLLMGLNEWNRLELYDNNDTNSIDFMNLANINNTLEIENTMKNELIKVKLIKIV